MLQWSIEALQGVDAIERIVVALPPGVHAPVGTTGVPGGEVRSASVRAALREAGDADVVVVHDAARPLVTPGIVQDCIDALATHDCDAAIAAARVTDTIKESRGEQVVRTLDRAGLWAVQTPQVFDRDVLARALDSADVVCVSGGVSVGPHDHVKAALADLGVEERFWGVRLQPGKPTWFGVREGKLVFGLPGNPVSAMVTFHLFARPAVRSLQGADPGIRAASARAAEALRRNPVRDQMVRVRLEADGEGWVARPTKAQGSHVLTSMLGAAALARVPAGDGDVEAGERIDIELL